MRNSLEEGGEGYSRFQVTGVIEGVFGFEIFNWGIFLGRKIWQLFLEWLVLDRDFWGYSKQSEDLWSSSAGVSRLRRSVTVFFSNAVHEILGS